MLISSSLSYSHIGADTVTVHPSIARREKSYTGVDREEFAENFVSTIIVSHGVDTV